MTIKHLIWGIALLGACVLVQGQPDGPNKRGPKANPEAQKEIKAYMAREVLPVLGPERERLDSYIGETEKNILANIRQEMEALRKEGKNFRKIMMEARKNGESPTEEQISQMRELGKKRRLLMNQAWTIADEYEIEIYEILDNIRPAAEKWQKDIQTIKAKYKAEDHPAGHSRKPETAGTDQRPPKSQRGRKGPGGRNPMGKLLESPVHFLLWDGTSLMDGMNAEHEPQAFPNPSTGSQTLTYKVKKAGKVSIELLDPNGTVVRSMENEAKEAGEYSLEVDTKGLKPGVYIYRISTPKGSKTKKVTIE